MQLYKETKSIAKIRKHLKGVNDLIGRKTGYKMRYLILAFYFNCCDVLVQKKFVPLK